MSVTLENFIQHVESGYFVERVLSAEEALVAGTWIMRNIVAVKRSPELLYEWETTSKLVSNEDYLTLLYACSLSMQYFYDSFEPKQTVNKNVIALCIALLDYLKSNDTSIDMSRLYWAKIGQLYHVLQNFEKELAVLNEGIRKIGSFLDWTPGMMTEIEHQLVKYSAMESLLAHKAICLYALEKLDECKAIMDQLFQSLHVRGEYDYVNGLYPDGIRPIYKEIKENLA